MKHKAMEDRLVIQFIWNRATLYRDVLGCEENIVRTPRLVSWQKPPQGHVKLNVDGSAFGNPGKVGFGGHVRSEDGGWIMGFYGFVGHATNLLAIEVSFLCGKQGSDALCVKLLKGDAIF